MKMSVNVRGKLLDIIKCLIFLCLLLTLLARYTKIVMNKLDLFCSATLNEHEKDSIEVLFLGSSQMIFAAQPMLLWEQYGFTSYNMATSATTIPGNYWAAEIAFETQKPKVVMLDCTFAYMETKTMGELPRIHSALDGFWPSRAVYRAVNDLIEDPDKRFEFFWTPYIYHTRWKELSQTDFEDISDNGAAGAYLRNVMYDLEGIVNQYPKDLTQDVPSIVLEYIEKLSFLCSGNNSELVLIILPVPMFVNYQPIYNTLEKWAEEHGIPFVNGYDDPKLWQLDYGTDFVDMAHMNIHGVKKSSTYIGDYLIRHYDLGISEDEQTNAFWNENLQEYKQFQDSIWTYPLLSYGSTITFSIDGNQEQYYGGTGGSARILAPGGLYTWSTGLRSDFYFYIEEPADALLQINLEAVQPIAGKTTRTIDVYVNEQYIESTEIEATSNPASFSVDIAKELWTDSEEQKLTFKYSDIDNNTSLKYTLALKEICLERK